MKTTIRRQAGPRFYTNKRGQQVRNWEWVVRDEQGYALAVLDTKRAAEKFVEDGADQAAFDAYLKTRCTAEQFAAYIARSA